VINPAPSPGPTLPASPSATTAAVDASALRDVRVLDLTFVGPNDGWALASADCVHGSGRCSAFLRTTDGTHWRSMPGPAFNVEDVRGCADPCVAHMRFANDSIGYAFGPSALFMTTDGGLHWQRQKGMGADALETLSGNVILAHLENASPPTVARAPIGSTNWQQITLPGGNPELGYGEPVIARAGRTVLLGAIRFDPAKGDGANGTQSASFYRSTDDGSTWTKAADPCPYVGDGYSDDSVVATVGSDGAIVIDCAVRNRAQPGFIGGSTITSTDGGKHFATPTAGGKLGPADFLAAADARTQVVFAGGDKSSGAGLPAARLWRSTDTGNSWSAVPQIAGTVTFLGFESATVGRAVTDNRTIWTTRDAGKTWQPTSLR
jgi:photosystem II stability/assembly factor-like uncharacterized protein